jgi:hypothetical protein
MLLYKNCEPNGRIPFCISGPFSFPLWKASCGEGGSRTLILIEWYWRRDGDGRPRDLTQRPSKCESDTKFLCVTLLESNHVLVQQQQQQSLAQTFYIWSPLRDATYRTRRSVETSLNRTEPTTGASAADCTTRLCVTSAAEITERKDEYQCWTESGRKL